MNTKRNNKIRRKIAGAVYGFAIGDSMGATTEFMTKEEIKMQYGIVDEIIGGGWLNLNPGDVTDDTQMTLCVMNALMNGKELFRENCINNFIEWLKSCPKDIGGQCLKGITYYIENNVPIPIDKNALGNGSLMRALPCALLNTPVLNVLQGMLTHNNITCSRIILEYTGLIQNLLYNDSFVYDDVKHLLEPTGCVINTFNNALYWSNTNSFEKAIIGAVNHGGDADTIAAITGSIAGAKLGIEYIPKRWIDELNPDIKKDLEKFIKFTFSYLQI